MFGRTLAGVFATMLAAQVHAQTESAQNYPAGPIRLIVNSAPGGVTDAVGRVVGQGLNELWGRTVVVENRAGGKSVIAAHAVSRAAPDGLTLLATADVMFTTNPSLFPNLAYSIDDFAPVSLICRPTGVVAVNADLGVKTMDEYIALARAKPGVLNYGSPGIGTYSHLGVEELKFRTGAKIVHVPYRGGAPAIEGLLRGDVGALIINLSNIAPFEETGQIRILAAAGDKRSAARPRSSDSLGIRPQGLRGQRLVRDIRAGENPASDRRQASRRHQQGARRPEGAGILRQQ